MSKSEGPSLQNDKSHVVIFGSERRPRRGNLGSLSVCPCILCNSALRMALKDILQHSKESRGLQGRQASKQANKNARGKEASKHTSKQECMHASTKRAFCRSHAL